MAAVKSSIKHMQHMQTPFVSFFVSQIQRFLSQLIHRVTFLSTSVTCHGSHERLTNERHLSDHIARLTRKEWQETPNEVLKCRKSRDVDALGPERS